MFQKQKIVICCFALFFIANKGLAQSSFPDISKDAKGNIVITQDNLGNQIPDFSYAGYAASEKPIPTIENKIFVPKQTQDATKIIQAAINYVSGLKPNALGYRGAVLLDKGIFKISGTVYIKSSGVVLRGSGKGSDGTVLLGTGLSRESLIRVLGVEDKKIQSQLTLGTTFLPLGSQTIRVQNAATLKVNNEITIAQPLTDKWIKELKMEEFGGETAWVGWKKVDWSVNWNRTVTKINGNEVTLSAPLTMALDSNYGEIKINSFTWTGRLETVGLENMTLQSEFDTSNPKDEQHRWLGISMENVKNAWVRQIQFQHFAGGAVHLLKSAQQITVEDCIATAPVSEIASFRRHTFYTEGQQTLFQRCYSEYGYHDFAVGGFGTAGPNAFVQCESHLPFENSGAIGSWATGILFDIATIDGHALSYNNREQNGRGAGWTAANSVIWESSASKVECYSPPTAQNWAFGVWGQFSGNGHWKDVNAHISPRSLFYAQLEKRLGQLPSNPFIYSIGSEPSSSPTIEQAAELTKASVTTATSLPEWIEKVSQLNSIKSSATGLKNANELHLLDDSKNTSITQVTIQNGWLTFGGKLIAGKQINVMWWRGSLLENDIQKASPHLTRFVPGRNGKGLTDAIEEVVDYMTANSMIALEHNYGLWYDRRMDDHERVRRFDSDVWPPFYEQPFARSGKDLAWDHLSKYDLSKYNSWYWDRLARFATLAEANGRLLIHQQYFQHNILEAGAHWASSPWRSANNINQTGFPEPPPYAGDKRIFMAEQFYDITNPTRKKIHQNYIRKSLENFQNNSNVIQLTSAEYTGPLHFMQFWLDEAQQWKEQTHSKGLIGLSATKDVQDAILADGNRNKTVDLIDIRYWYYKDDGTLYAPQGGLNLAPRQHARKLKTGRETEEQVYRAVREYREKYPSKVVLYSTDASSRFGWSVLFGGGSLPSLPKVSLPEFYTALPSMQIVNGNAYSDNVWKLENKGKSYLMYLKKLQDISINLSAYKGTFDVYFINQDSGSVVKKQTVAGGNIVVIPAAGVTEKVVFIIKK